MWEAGQAPDEVVGCAVLRRLGVWELGVFGREVDACLEGCDVSDPLDEEWGPARGAAGVGAAPRPGGHQAGVPFMTDASMSPSIALTTSANAVRRVSAGRSSL